MKKETKNKIRTAVVNVILITLFIVMVVTIFRIFNARSKNKVYFVFNKYSLMWVLTDSMEDLIPAQSYILVENAAGKTITRGMIISFYSEDPAIYGKLNTHVVLGIEEVNGRYFYTTRPYRSNTPDEYKVPEENVVAVYVCNVPFLTDVGKFIQGTGGKLLIGVLLIGFTALWFIRSYLTKLIAMRNEAQRQKLHAEMTQRIMNEEMERMRMRDAFIYQNNLAMNRANQAPPPKQEAPGSVQQQQQQPQYYEVPQYVTETQYVPAEQYIQEEQQYIPEEQIEYYYEEQWAPEEQYGPIEQVEYYEEPQYVPEEQYATEEQYASEEQYQIENYDDTYIEQYEYTYTYDATLETANVKGE